MSAQPRQDAREADITNDITAAVFKRLASKVLVLQLINNNRKDTRIIANIRYWTMERCHGIARRAYL
ncbi:hypothetical protein LSAT2_029790 [Lamellibrachia satsuma]|nr:hypothetical protein LSAT2_029790 [Lamellibrachia satsuma]